MKLNDIFIAEILYSELAANYSKIIGNRKFLSGELAIITKDNQYVFILENLIQLGLVRKLESGFYKLDTSISGRLKNLNSTKRNFELIIAEAKSEIERIDKIKETLVKLKTIREIKRKNGEKRVSG